MPTHARFCTGRVLGLAALAAGLLSCLAGMGLHASPFDPIKALSTQDGAEEGGESYEVVSGDTLWAIAERFLGDGSRWREIFDANSDQIQNPNLIYPGQKLKIPGGRNKSSPGAPGTSGGGSGSGGGSSGGAATRGTHEAFTRLPLNHSSISSPFGPRQSPCPGCSSFHKGIDLHASRGTPVYAVGPGRVVGASFEEGGGNTISIDHGGGYRSSYLHLQHGSFKVRAGDDVKAGHHIANVNNTGAYTTGDHLHFAISRNGVLIDPQNVLRVPQGW